MAVLMELPHIPDQAALERRIRGAVRSALDSHSGPPSVESIAKRIIGELLADHEPSPPPRRIKRRTAPERLRKELVGTIRRARLIRDKPDRVDSIVATLERRVLRIIEGYTILD